MEEQKTELKMIRMSEIESQEVKWLMNRAFQKGHWKMPKRSLVSGLRKLTIHGIGSWIR